MSEWHTSFWAVHIFCRCRALAQASKNFVRICMDYIYTHSINLRAGIKGASCYLTEENRMQLLQLERKKTQKMQIQKTSSRPEFLNSCITSRTMSTYKDLSRNLSEIQVHSRGQDISSQAEDTVCFIKVFGRDHKEYLKLPRLSKGKKQKGAICICNLSLPHSFGISSWYRSVFFPNYIVKRSEATFPDHRSTKKGEEAPTPNLHTVSCFFLSFINYKIPSSPVP